jgi:hypothetical protein
MDVRWQADDAARHDRSSPVNFPIQPRVEQDEPSQPAESRTFATVEVCVLMIGFAMTGSAMSDAQNWRRASTAQVVLGVVIYLAIGLSFSGPIMVSWRERLGRRRPVWGVGESLWFALGLPVQDGVLSVLIGRWCGGAWGGLCFLGLLFLLSWIYLTGNPLIQCARAPLSWSNIVGILSVALWGLTVVAAIVAQP